MKIFLLLLSFMILTAGVCEMVPESDKISESDIYGIYKANFNSGLVDQINILPNNKYVRFYMTFDSLKYFDTGRYDFRYLNDCSTTAWITFPDFINRFTIDTLKRNLNVFYYKGSDGVKDSSFTYHDIRLWKDESSKHTVIRIGNIYGQAWVKYELK